MAQVISAIEVCVAFALSVCVRVAATDAAPMGQQTVEASTSLAVYL